MFRFIFFYLCVVGLLGLSLYEADAGRFPPHPIGGGSPPPVVACSDPVPPQAAAAGFHTEVYCWGPGDTLAEIDGTNTRLPGYKLYPPSVIPSTGEPPFGFPTSPADYSMSGGKLIIKPRAGVNDTALNGGFILGTCGAPSPSSNHWGLGFMTAPGGFYLEGKMEWNWGGGGFGKLGLWSLDVESINNNLVGSHGFGIELDNPDDSAFLVQWNKWDWTAGMIAYQGGGVTTQPNTTVQTGDALGMLMTPSAFTYWLNGSANGTAAVLSADLSFEIGLHYCWGFQANTSTNETVDYLRIWQSP